MHVQAAAKLTVVECCYGYICYIQVITHCLKRCSLFIQTSTAKYIFNRQPSHALFATRVTRGPVVQTKPKEQIISSVMCIHVIAHVLLHPYWIQPAVTHQIYLEHEAALVL